MYRNVANALRMNMTYCIIRGNLHGSPHNVLEMCKVASTKCREKAFARAVGLGTSLTLMGKAEMKGVEFLRNVYASAGLSIRPKTKMGQIEALKEIIRAWGMNPERVLAREALTQGATVYVNSETRMTNEVQILSRTLRELIQQDSSNGEQHQRIVQIPSVGVNSRRARSHSGMEQTIFLCALSDESNPMDERVRI